MQPIVVIGGSLAGMAAAARLAKAGHRVELYEATDRLGGRAAPYALDDGTIVDDLPAVITFPAPIRDLFRKSGRPLEAELARAKAELVPADPVRLSFADGSEFDWPSDRGEQYTTLTGAYGPRAADRWRSLIDDLDDVWQVIRRLGLEIELLDRRQLTRSTLTAVRHRQSLADLAERAGHPHLTALLRSAAYGVGSRPESTPAFVAAAASVERTFGRWRIATQDGRDGQSSVLVAALAERLSTRKVGVHLNQRVSGIDVERGRVVAVRTPDGQIPASAVVAGVDPWQLLDHLLPRTAARRTRRRVRRLHPALAPTISHHRDTETSAQTPAPAVRIDLDPTGCPLITYTRPTGVVSVHDYRRARPDPGAGAAWHGFGDWLRRPPVTTEITGLYTAGAASPGGAGLSSVLLSGALASYGVHDLLSARDR